MTPKTARLALSLALCALIAVSVAFYAQGRENVRQENEHLRAQNAWLQARAKFADSVIEVLGRVNTGGKVREVTPEEKVAEWHYALERLLRERDITRDENEALKARLDSIERGVVIPAGTRRAIERTLYQEDAPWPTLQEEFPGFMAEVYPLTRALTPKLPTETECPLWRP